MTLSLEGVAASGPAVRKRSGVIILVCENRSMSSSGQDETQLLASCFRIFTQTASSLWEYIPAGLWRTHRAQTLAAEKSGDRYPRSEHVQNHLLNRGHPYVLYRATRKEMPGNARLGISCDITVSMPSWTTVS